MYIQLPKSFPSAYTIALLPGFARLVFPLERFKAECLDPSVLSNQLLALCPALLLIISRMSATKFIIQIACTLIFHFNAYSTAQNIGKS